MWKAVNKNSRTIGRKNRHTKVVSSKIVAKIRDTVKEQSLFATSSKNKDLTKDAGIVYLYKIGECG